MARPKTIVCNGVADRLRLRIGFPQRPLVKSMKASLDKNGLSIGGEMCYVNQEEAGC